MKWPPSQPVVPLCLFGSVFYYQCLAIGAIIDPFENYVKQSLRNRYQILSSQGVVTLQVPVTGQKGNKVPTSEIEVFDQRWQRRHLQSIKTSYGSAPYFIHYFDDLQRLFEKEYDLLSEICIASIELSNEWLNGLLNHTVADDYQEVEDPSSDLRSYFKQTKVRVEQPPYSQVFFDRMPFAGDLSIIDVIMHLGPEAGAYVQLAPISIVKS